MGITLNKLTQIKVVSLFALSFFFPHQFSFANNLKYDEWFVRLIAEAPAENLKDAGNVLGSLRSSSNDYDKHDLKELPPFTAPYLTIVFPHPEWGDKAGNYASDFHRTRHWRLGDEWEFTVNASTADLEVTLTWEGFDRLKRLWAMQLIDLENGTVVDAVKNRKLNHYTFNMAGTSHRFKWVYLARPAQ